MKILITANTAWNIYNFRVELVDALKADGHDVLIVVPVDAFTNLVKKKGYNVRNIRIYNKSINPLRELITAIEYYRIMSQESPNLTLNFTIKPVIYATLAARLCGIRSINTFTGLGTAFLKNNLLRQLVIMMLRLVLRSADCNFAHNKDDLNLLREIASEPETKIKAIGGSGIDLSDFTPEKISRDKKIVFLMIARLLRDKGIDEYLEAASIIAKRSSHVECRLLGALDPKNRSGITKAEFEEKIIGNAVQYRGVADDVRGEILEAHCIVLPSYREGLPRVLLEGGAMGRPLIATDVPGCRAIVIDEWNGYLCRVKDPIDLAEKMAKFIDAPYEERSEMGLNARKHVERNFSLGPVIEAYREAVGKTDC